MSADPTPDKHCDLHDTTPKKEGAAVAPGTTGTIMVGGESVGYTISADGKTVTFTEAVEFCVKASIDNSGLESGTSYTVDFLNPGDQTPGISYFVVYGLTEEEEPETGSITIRKNSVPDHLDYDFPFTTTGAGLTGFSLDDDTDPTLPRERTFNDLAPGTYTVTEGIVEPWTLTQLDCSEGGTGVISLRKATIELTAGAHVTCTFVNTKLATSQQGTITIVKDATPNSAQDFAFTTTGAGLVGFSLDDDADSALPNQLTFTGLALGNYTVTESAAAGWMLTHLTCSPGGTADLAVRTASITVVAGAHVTCTFVNSPIQPAPGSITIIKDAAPNAAADFAFTTTGTGLSSFSLDDDADATLSNQKAFTGLAAGNYSVIESPMTGWTLSSITCSTGGSGNTTTRTASIVLAAGANVTCTFVNTQVVQPPALGSITIIKNGVPDGAQDFAFTTTGTGLSSFSLDDDADATLGSQKSFTALAAGNYSVIETPMTGWTLSSITCSTGGSGNTTTGTASIVLAAGANVTCTFVNTQVVQGSGNLPSAAGPVTVVREGTQAGNPPLPNTAMPLALTGSTQAALLALASLLALGAVGVAVAVEGRRRR